MKRLGQTIIVLGSIILLWSLYIFVKYFGLGGDNSYTPFTGLLGVILIAFGARLRKK
jgi:hypothetical protein